MHTGNTEDHTHIPSDSSQSQPYITYINRYDAKGNKKPIACVAICDNYKYGLLFIGVSKCNKKDMFVKKSGRTLAINRLYGSINVFSSKGSPDGRFKIPQSIHEDINIILNNYIYNTGTKSRLFSTMYKFE